MSHIIVTGGAGFIGKHLVKKLLLDGYKVTVLDDFSFSERIEESDLEPNLEIIPMSLGDLRTDLSKYFREDTELCYHLAANSSVVRSEIDWENSHRSNLLSGIHIFKTINRLKKQIPVVYTSSAAVYGNIGLYQEHYDPEGPVSPTNSYGIDKYSMEIYAKYFCYNSEIPSWGLRLFNVYGIGQNPNSTYSGVITKFINAILANKDLEIYGNGTQVRDFVYIDNVIGVLTLPLSKPELLKKNQADVKNVCTGHGTNIKDLAEKIRNLAPPAVESRIIFVDDKEPGDLFSVGKIDPCLKMHHFQDHSVSLDDGLRRMLRELHLTKSLKV